MLLSLYLLSVKYKYQVYIGIRANDLWSAIEEDYDVLPLLESDEFGISKNHTGISQKGIREIKEPA